MMSPYFISYSRVDGLEHSLRLHDSLLSGPPVIPVWHDQRMGIHTSHVGWPKQVEEALERCAGVLFVTTKGSVNDNSVCGAELYAALTHRKVIVPLLFDDDVAVPFLYQRLQHVGFSHFDRGLAELRRQLEWLEQPEGRIYALAFQRQTLERKLVPDLDPAVRHRILDELERIDDDAARLRNAVENPRKVEQAQRQNIDRAIAKERQRPVGDQPAEHAMTVYRPPAAPPLFFFDRVAETRLIGQFLQDPSKRLLTVMGRGGVGKTAMVSRICDQLARGEFVGTSERPITVEGIVYMGKGAEKGITVENVYLGLCRLLPIGIRQSTEDAWAGTMDVRAQIDAVASRFTHQPVVLFMDNFEDLIDPSTQRISRRDVQEMLEAVLELPHHSLKVVITTREAPADLAFHRPERQTLLPLDKGLNSPDAEDLLRSLDEDGRLGLRSASDATLNEVRIRTLGIPRALEIFCAILSDPYSSLGEVLSDAAHYLPDEVVNRLSAEAFHRLDRTGQRVIQALAVFGRPVIPEAVDYVLQPFEPGLASEPTLRRLVRMYLVRRESGHCFLHPVDQLYAKASVQMAATPEGVENSSLPYSLQNLLRRAAEYFRQIRTKESAWTSIADLSPQLAEFDLLIEAGDDGTALEVFVGLGVYLERWGYRRQIVRMAAALAPRLTGTARAEIVATAGEAHYSLEEFDLAAMRYEEALSASDDGDVLARFRLMLCLANCRVALQENEAASRLFDVILRDSPQADVALNAAALTGLARIAMRRNDATTAELLYFRALDIYVGACGREIEELGETTQVTIVDTPNDLAIADPGAWHFLRRLVPAEQDGVGGSESGSESSALILFGVGDLEVSVETEESADGGDLAGEKSTTEPFPLAVDSVLAGIWMDLASLYERWDRYAQARSACVLATQMFVELGDDDGTLDALELLRRILANFSRLDAVAVLEDQQRVLEQVRPTGNRRLMGRILQILASSYEEHDKLDQAESAYSELRRVAIELEDVSLEEAAELGEAKTMRLKGEYAQAAEKYNVLLRQVGTRRPELRGQIEHELGLIELANYDAKAAANHFEASARAYIAGDNKVGCVYAQRSLASLAIEHRDYESAIERLERTLELSRQVDIPSVTSSTLADLAGAYAAGGHHESAVAAADEARRLADKIDVPRTQAEILLTLATIYTNQRRFDAAKETSRQAREISRQLGDIRGEISALQSFANVCSRTVEADAQLQAAREARELAERIPDPEEKRVAGMTVALALSDAERYDEAIDIFDEAIRKRPLDARAVGNFASVLLDAAQYERSIAQSRLALDIDPTQTFALRNIGHALLALGRAGEAEKAYQLAIEQRRGGEDFHESIRNVKKLLDKQPNLLRGAEMLALLERAQETLERDWKDAAQLRERQ